MPATFQPAVARGSSQQQHGDHDSTASSWQRRRGQAVSYPARRALSIHGHMLLGESRTSLRVSVGLSEGPCSTVPVGRVNV